MFTIVYTMLALATFASVVRADDSNGSNSGISATCGASGLIIIVRTAQAPLPNIELVPAEARASLQQLQQLIRALESVGPRAEQNRARFDSLQAAIKAVKDALRGVLEHHVAALSPEAWLVLAQLRFDHASEQSFADESYDPDVQPALFAVRHAQAPSANAETAMWARYLGAHYVGAYLDDAAEALRALSVVAAHATGDLLAHSYYAMAFTYAHEGDRDLANHYYDRAIPLLRGDDRRDALLLSMILNETADPERAFTRGLLYLREENASRIQSAALDMVASLAHDGGAQYRTRLQLELPRPVVEQIMHRLAHTH